MSSRGQSFRWAAGITLATVCLFSPVQAVSFYSEDFESVTLGQTVTFQTEVAALEAWSPDGPAGWSVDRSAIPGLGDPLLGGVTEFEGWNFVSKDWWIQTAGDQGRANYVGASGVVAVADPDEWDDLNDPTGAPDVNMFDSTLATPSISLSGVGANAGRLRFNSSWQPEGNQTATVNVSYNGGASTELLRWTSVSTDPNFHDVSTNEIVDLALDNPAGGTMELEFRLFDAFNNWFWAVDNIQAYTDTPDPEDGLLQAVINRDSGNVQIQQSGGPVDLRGYSLRSSAGALDESAAEFRADANASWVQLTAADSTGDLSEGHLSSETLSGDATIDLGEPWLKYFADTSDISFEYLVAGNSQPIPGLVSFTGNGDESFAFLDLNFDGEIDINDWEAFKAGVGTPLDGLSTVQAYQLSDLDLDGAHTVQDFQAFKNEFDSVNGAGAFASMVSAVPEPTALSLWFMAAVSCLLPRRRNSSDYLQKLWPSVSRWAVAGTALLVMWLGTAERGTAQLIIFSEDFNGLTLGNSVDEGVAAPVGDAGGTVAENVWTNVPPTGWVKDDTGVPGFGNASDNNGVAEWIGFTFADRDWWVDTAGGQRREEFTLASGVVMVADPDEWDDADHPGEMGAVPDPPGTVEGEWFDAFISTPPVSLAGIPANKAEVAFDSSWRDEFDGSFQQTAIMTASFDGGDPIEILRWESDPESNFFKDDAPNESINVPLNNPEGAGEVVIEFGLIDAGNDWWWAADNFRVQVPADPSFLRVDTESGGAEIVAGDTIGVPFNSYEVRSDMDGLNGNALTGLKDTDEEVDGPDEGSTPGDSPGEQWEVLNASDSQVFEAFLFGSSTLAADASGSGEGSGGGSSFSTIGLGGIYDTGVADMNLEFIYTTAFGTEISGMVEYCTSCVPVDMTGLPGDTNGDGQVNFGDLSPFVQALTDPTGYQEDFPGLYPTSCDIDDSGMCNFGDLSPFVGLLTGGGSGSSQAVPEPGSLSLILLTGLALLLQRRSAPCVPWMRLSGLAGAIAATLVFVSSASADVSVDRLYRLGDSTNPDEGAVDGAQVGSGNESGTSFVEIGGEGQPGFFADLIPSTSRPTYVAISGRPDGGGGLGVQFGTSTFLRAPNLNLPDESFTSENNGTPFPGPIDYEFIDDRGLQFWARTPSTVEQATLVTDGGQHGVKINADGNWVMQYAGADTASSTTASADTWYHLMVVRPAEGGSRLYVDGIAEAAAGGGYSSSEIVLGVGAAVAEIAGTGLFQGSDYFKGIIDDLEMFAMGLNNSANYGQFDPGTDNDFIAGNAPSNPVDLTGDNNITSADVDAFVAGWLNTKVINGIQVGDLETRMNGDFNYDGTTDLIDWGLLNDASPAAGAAALAAINGVPEPATCVLLLIALSVLPRVRWRLS